MFSINNAGTIRLTRGDSGEFLYKINIGDNMSPMFYQLNENDELFLGIMEPNQPFESAIIRKYFRSNDMDENGNVKISFKPNDTVCLMPGLYYYQLKLVDVTQNIVRTLNPKTQLWIEE